MKFDLEGDRQRGEPEIIDKDNREGFTRIYKDIANDVKSQCIADVSGGAKVYMKKFLIKGCMHDMEASNP